MDVPLSEEGFEQLESKEFVEKVLRIQPDVIVSSNYLRAKQTAEGAQKVMKAYA